MMLSLVTLGYQKLGLTDETRELRDLDDARLAIELLRGVSTCWTRAAARPVGRAGAPLPARSSPARPCS